MATKHIVANWTFNGNAFAEALRNSVNKGDFKALAELLEVSETTVARWATDTHHSAFPHPSMGNFIKVCNILDLDPRSFWELDA